MAVELSVVVGKLIRIIDQFSTIVPGLCVIFQLYTHLTYLQSAQALAHDKLSLYHAAVTRETKPFQNYFTLRRLDVLTEIILSKVISKLFQRLIAAHEYFPTCSMSLK